MKRLKLVKLGLLVKKEASEKNTEQTQTPKTSPPDTLNPLTRIFTDRLNMILCQLVRRGGLCAQCVLAHG